MRKFKSFRFPYASDIAAIYATEETAYMNEHGFYRNSQLTDDDYDIIRERGKEKIKKYVEFLKHGGKSLESQVQ